MFLVHSTRDGLLQKKPVENAVRFLWPGRGHPFGFAQKWREDFKRGAQALLFGKGSSASLEFGHKREHDVIIKQILSHLFVSLQKWDEPY